MTPPHLLDPDLREAARRLIATGRLRAESDPELYRTAVKGATALAQFFRAELGWRLEVHEVAELVRLHKRRADVPDDRGPHLPRDGRATQTAPTEVLVLVCLVCEQLWRRPRVTLRELLQAVAQVCAAEAPTGRLPQFRIVASDGTGKKEARESRRHLVDALKLLVAEGSLTVDADLDRAVTDEDSDLVVTASRDRLAAKFSSLSPTLLGLDDLSPQAHAAALSAESLLDHTAAALDEPAGGPTRDERRLKALRRLVDDPATDPHDDAAQTTAYLHTLTGRERALSVVSCLGLAATVRRDWWQITDPTGLGSGIDFPQGRRTERQAALALLAELPRRADPTGPLPLTEVTALFQRHRDDLPRWAAAYDRRLPALARAATAELVQAGLLTADPDIPDHWHPTPGIYLWRTHLRHPPSPVPAEHAPSATPPRHTPGRQELNP
ncbi:DUF2398 family protein [Streptomyces albus]|uniref:DUF2398 family protein n=3 Tax=Streptomyces albus TaxID=1888 RepID=A0A6C1BVJ6_9ACTN|nr:MULTISPECIES: DUF2398 family protein [Streptomyces]QID34259.1 DUF2398 family protein [Streptomyces albus]TGG80858.1 DUF2398 family protein [Streptomyces albus]UVN58867.1 TIGR02678 family protein [Streptomyces albus]GHJ19121.1 hypothetical protein TPA0909_07350 [Streptomyces albus]